MTDTIHYAFCWYKEEQWERLKEIVTDSESIEDSYAEWKQCAEKSLVELRNNGLHVQKVITDTESLLLWANERNRAIDSAARSEYAIFTLKQREQVRENKK